MSRRRHYRGITDVSFGSLKSAVTGSVKGTDVLLGSLAGLAGVAAAKWGVSKVEPMLAAKGVTVPELVCDFAPLVGAGAAGLALHIGLKGSAKSDGMLVGALSGGLAITAGTLAAKYNVPGFNGVVSVNLKGFVTPQIPLNRSRSMGLIAPSRKQLSLIAPSARPAMGLIAPSRARAE